MAVRISTSPLTGRIFRGKVNRQGTAFIGEKQDVTSDVLRSVIEKAEFHGGAFDIEAGERKWLVTVWDESATVDVTSLVRRGMAQLDAWHAKYGANQPDWLPPAGDVRWLEAAAAFLAALKEQQ